MASPLFKPLVACLVALAPLLVASSGRAAAEPSPSEISVARRLFDEARSAEEAGRWREAAEKFRSAIAIKDTPGMRFHLARCEEEQGAFVEALVEYDRARELIDSGVRAADVEKLLAGARERVRAKVALLTLKLPKEVQNVSVELDGQALSRSVVGQPIPINPGKHRVTAVAVGRSKFSGDVELGTGEVRQLAVELPEATTVTPPVAAPPPGPPASLPVAASEPAASKVADPPARTQTWLLVGEGALFVAGLTTGIGFTIAKSSADHDYAVASASPTLGDDPRACTRTPDAIDCIKLRNALDARSRDATLAAVGFVGAGVSAVAFGLTYFFWPNGEAPADVHARASRDGMFLSVNGRF